MTNTLTDSLLIPEAELDRATVVEVALDYLVDLDDRFHVLTPDKRAALDQIVHHDPFATIGQTWKPGDVAAAAARETRLRGVVDRLTAAFPVEED